MERHHHLRQMAVQQLRQPSEFADKLQASGLKPAGVLPESLARLFGKFLPQGAEPVYHLLKKPKGLGSLGRRRYLAIVPDWQGGMLAREAKDVVPSACVWAEKKKAKGNPWIEPTVRRAVRCEDPFYEVKGRWLVRRLAPDCSRIDLAELKHHEDFAELLSCMGAETANIHLGTSGARKALVKTLADLPKAWLKDAALIMYEKSLKDWKTFKSTKDETSPAK